MILSNDIMLLNQDFNTVTNELKQTIKKFYRNQIYLKKNTSIIIIILFLKNSMFTFIVSNNNYNILFYDIY